MQPLVDPVRSDLTDADVVALIQDSTAMTVSCGLELLARDLSVTADLSTDFAGGTVSRASYATLHGTAALSMSVLLDWGQALVRPNIVLSDGLIQARFNLGAYFTSTPHWDLDVTPPVYDVAGFDVLHGLSSAVGEVYAVDAGAAYLTTVESILVAQGYTGAYVIDQQAIGSVLPTARVWLIDEQITWLTIVNDLLASIGYAGIWSDWDGRLQCRPYANPRERAPEWLYDTSSTTGMMTVSRTIEEDWFNAPNRWVGIRSNNVDSVAPAEGAGIYTAVNEFDGPASVEARGGRIFTRILPLDVADQAALIALTEQAIDADLRLKTSLSVGVAPNPLHWHFDRVLINDPAIGAAVDMLVTDWTLPLNGDDMRCEMTVLT
jgi:hypothetical protein